MFKRIFLFLLVSLGISIMLITTASLLGLSTGVSSSGIHLQQLVMFCLFYGMGGSAISLLLSKPIAKWTTGAKVISGNEGTTERWLVDTVAVLAKEANIGMPEVAVFNGAPNAFATGATKNGSLVAVSTGLVQSMNKNQVRAVLAHEISHVSNGDMVTLAVISGLVNAFVMVIARVIGFFVDKVVLKNEEGLGMGYYVTTFIMDIVIGLLASLVVFYFSRVREFKADAGAASLVGKDAMISALKELQDITKQTEVALPKQMAAAGIAGESSWLNLFSTHPTLDARIKALESI